MLGFISKAKDEAIELKHCNTHDQLIDILTKPLKLDSFVKMKEGLGIETLTNVTRLLWRSQSKREIVVYNY